MRQLKAKLNQIREQVADLQKREIVLINSDNLSEDELIHNAIESDRSIDRDKDIFIILNIQ